LIPIEYNNNNVTLNGITVIEPDVVATSAVAGDNNNHITNNYGNNIIQANGCRGSKKSPLNPGGTESEVMLNNGALKSKSNSLASNKVSCEGS